MYQRLFRATVLMAICVAASAGTGPTRPKAPDSTDVAPLGDPEQKTQAIPIQVTHLAPTELAPGDVLEVSNAITIGLVNEKLSLASKLIPEADFTMGIACKGRQPVSLLRTIRVPIPVNAKEGAYLVSICSISSDKDEVRLIVPVRIVRRTPQLAWVDPPSLAGANYSMKILGRDLAPDDKLWLSCGGREEEAVATPTVGDGGQTLTISFKRPNSFVRVCRARLSTTGGQWSNSVEVHFGIATDPVWPRVVALTAGLTVLGLLTGLLLGVQRIKEGNPWWLRLVTDEGARRISLSRLQLYAWVLSAVPATILLSILDGGLRTPLPNGVLAFSFICLLTAAFGTYLNYERWSDGPAQARASVSDLFMEFGLIHWERVIYCLGIALTLVYFLATLYLKITDGTEYLYDIPFWLVLLDAVLAALFLLGKIARVRGPQLRGVEAVQGSLQLTITGSNLSKDATFFLGKEEIKPQTMDLNSDGEHKPEIVLEDYSRRGYANILRLKIGLPDENQWKETNVLTVRNPDGQIAQCKFALAVAITDLPTNAPEGSTIHLGGRGFHAECVVKLIQGTPPCESTCNTVWEKKNSVKVTLPRKPGLGWLVLVNPNQSTASRLIRVEPAPLAKSDD